MKNENISEKIGADIVNVVNSANDTYLRAQKDKNGIGTNIKPRESGIQ